VKLEEAQASYRPQTEDSKPRDNRRINTFLKAELRKLAEQKLGAHWDQISSSYRDDFSIQGSPEEGSATLTLKDARGCFGFGADQKSELRIERPQRELFES